MSGDTLSLLFICRSSGRLSPHLLYAIAALERAHARHHAPARNPASVLPEAPYVVAECGPCTRPAGTFDNFPRSNKSFNQGLKHFSGDQPACRFGHLTCGWRSASQCGPFLESEGISSSLFFALRMPPRVFRDGVAALFRVPGQASGLGLFLPSGILRYRSGYFDDSQLPY